MYKVSTMPRKCCVPGCRSNYAGETEKVSAFSFPSDEGKKKLWLSKIPRADFAPTKHSVVCAKHFSEQFIVRVDNVTRPDGSVLSVERQVPKLTDDAYPSVFPNCPSYLSKEPPPKRKKPEERQQASVQRDEEAFQQWLESDNIQDFVRFQADFTKHVGINWLAKQHKTNSGQEYISFYRILERDNSSPVLLSAIRIFTDMHVEVYTESTARVPDSQLKWIFGQQSPPTLSLWSQFDTLMSHYSSVSAMKSDKWEDQMNNLICCLRDLCDQTEVCGDEESDGKKKVSFLVEQLSLYFSQNRRYSTDTLLWAFKIFSSSPNTYSMIRSSILSLPSITYLRRLASVFQVSSGIETDTTHASYLRQKCELLKEDERSVILMIDEIHVSHQVSFKGGKLEGAAHNTSSVGATTAQVFMISSYLSKAKDIAAIVPVKNANTKELHEMIVQVLRFLHTIGYIVMCIISDNNRINRNAFTSLCDGKLSPSIPHPVSPTEKLFLLFDSVHLMKSIRNNWLSQKDAEMTFVFPSMHDGDVKKASFSHLRRIFSEEKGSVVKVAPSLNSKCLFPTSTEKQNVSLMLKVFDQRNVAALEHFETLWKLDTSGTKEFITNIVKLWNVLNVKHPRKHIRLRNKDCQPITTESPENIQFLQSICEWVESWEQLKQKPREGTLSKETMFALKHTLKGMVSLCHHLLTVKGYHYILTGKFQTDNLEFRFSQYRQLSGSNYHISVQQLLESERKLKLVSMLEMISASRGTISFKTVSESLEESQIVDTLNANESIHQFLPFTADCDEIQLTSEQSKSLVYIAGYAVSKVIPSVECNSCKTDLMTSDKQMILEGSSDCFSYISALDRGGLIWPSQVVLEIVTIVFVTFQAIIGKAASEDLFLKCACQKAVLTELVSKRLSDVDFTWEVCDSCGESAEIVLKKCCKPTINILLNNYSKQFCDKNTSANARKLKTFGKRI